MSATFFCQWEKPRIDSESGVIHGVAVVTMGPAKGHGLHADAKTLETVAQCAARYSNGVRVKTEHEGTLLDSVGMLKNWRIDNNTLRADLHMLDSDPASRIKILEMAEKMPDTFGLSIDFELTAEEIGGRRFARCTKLRNVALVEEPAANPALFSTMENVEEIVKAAVEAAMKPYTEEMAALKAKLSEMKPEVPEEVKSEMAALSASVTTLRAELATKTETAKNDAITALAAKLGVQDVSTARWNVSPANPGSNPEKFAELRAAFAEARKTGASASRAALSARNKNPKLYDEFLAAHKGDVSKLA